MLSRFHLIPERNGQTDGRTDRQICYISIARLYADARWKPIHSKKHKLPWLPGQETEWPILYRPRDHMGQAYRLAGSPVSCRQLEATPVPYTPLLRGKFHSEVEFAVVDPPAKFNECSFIHSRNIWGGLKFKNWSRNSEHTDFREFFPRVELAVVEPLAKFKVRSFIHSRNTEGSLKFSKGPRDPDDAPFRGKFSAMGWTLQWAIPDPFAKFEERRFIHSRNIKGV